jgi:serine/threonine-protein kinase RsbW
MSADPIFKCRIGNHIENLPQILDGLESTGLSHDWDLAFQMQLALVIEELVVNAINYGGQAEGQGWAEVRVEPAEGGVTVLIEDNGRAFDPFSVAEPDTDLDLDSRAVGGLGVHFVREMTDSYRYERAGEVNRVTLVKQYPA